MDVTRMEKKQNKNWKKECIELLEKNDGVEYALSESISFSIDDGRESEFFVRLGTGGIDIWYSIIPNEYQGENAIPAGEEIEGTVAVYDKDLFDEIAKHCDGVAKKPMMDVTRMKEKPVKLFKGYAQLETIIHEIMVSQKKGCGGRGYPTWDFTNGVLSCEKILGESELWFHWGKLLVVRKEDKYAKKTAGMLEELDEWNTGEDETITLIGKKQKDGE